MYGLNVFKIITFSSFLVTFRAYISSEIFFILGEFSQDIIQHSIVSWEPRQNNERKSFNSIKEYNVRGRIFILNNLKIMHKLSHL